jgi:hypothetical protein
VISRANSLSSRRFAGPLSSDVPPGDGVRRGARFVGGIFLASFYRRWPLGRRLRLFFFDDSLAVVARFSGHRSLLLFCVGVGLFFGAGHVRYGSFAGVSASAAPECDCLGQRRSSSGRVWCCSLALSAVASGLSSSTWLTTAASDCFFPWQHRSGNGRRAFSVLSTAWKVHVIECCGISEFKVWRCYSAGFLTGFVVRCFSSLAQSYGRRRSSLVKSREPGWGSFVISLISRVFVVKRVCSVDCPI